MLTVATVETAVLFLHLGLDPRLFVSSKVAAHVCVDIIDHATLVVLFRYHLHLFRCAIEIQEKLILIIFFFIQQ